jgi:hypothetical protein
MKTEFIPYEQALEIKELGFDEGCLASWNCYTNNFNYNSSPSTFTSQDVIQLPLYKQAFRWFRKKHKLFGQVNICTYFICDISNEFKTINQYDKLTSTYEEAELACLKKLIEIVKTK